MDVSLSCYAAVYSCVYHPFLVFAWPWWILYWHFFHSSSNHLLRSFYYQLALKLSAPAYNLFNLKLIISARSFSFLLIITTCIGSYRYLTLLFCCWWWFTLTAGASSTYLLDTSFRTHLRLIIIVSFIIVACGTFRSLHRLPLDIFYNVLWQAMWSAGLTVYLYLLSQTC